MILHPQHHRTIYDMLNKCTFSIINTQWYLNYRSSTLQFRPNVLTSFCLYDLLTAGKHLKGISHFATNISHYSSLWTPYDVTNLSHSDIQFQPLNSLELNFFTVFSNVTQLT